MTNIPLVGRDREIEVLDALVRRAQDGAGALALIEGEAGIGKTRLVAELLERAAGQGVVPLAAAAEELDRRRPFAVVADCLGIHLGADPARAALAERLMARPSGRRPGLRPDAADRELWVGESVLALVDELSAGAPIAIVVEDLQWADTASLALLQRLGRRVAGRRILLVCTCRAGPRPAGVDRLAASLVADGAHHLVLDALDEDAVEALVGALAGGPPGPNLVRQAAGGGGNPFYVTELVAELRRLGALAHGAGGTAEVATVATPSSLGRTILGRLSFLSEEALELLRLAAVVGPVVAAAELAAATGRRAVELSATLRACIAAGVLVDRGDRLAFRHDLIRDALYEDLPPSLRGQLHREIGQALAAADASPARVAEHLARAAVPGDSEAVRWLRRAALDAAPQAPAVACELLERALDLASASEPERGAIRADRAVCLMWSGRLAEAEAAAGDALAASCEPTVEGALRLCRVQALLALGRVPEALEEAERAAASPGLPETDRAQAQAWAALAGVLAGGPTAAGRDTGLALARAEASHDPMAISLSLRALSLGCCRSGDAAGALAHADRAVQMADHGPPLAPAQRLGLHLARGAALVQLDRLTAAGQAFREGAAAAEACGARSIVPMCQVGVGFVQFLAGEWDDAATGLGAAVAMADETGVGWLAGAYAIEAVIAFHRGHLAAAERGVAAAQRALAATPADRGAAWTVRARALLLESDGRPDAALAALAGAWDAAAATGAAADELLLGAHLVRVALARGDRSRAVTVARRLDELAAAAPGVPTVAGAALRCRGMVDDDPYLLLRAVAVHRTGPRPLELALACEEAAAALERARGSEAARQLLTTALAGYERMGAAREVARLDARLREAGVRRGARGRRKKRPNTGWGALTPTERQVVALVAEGMSNPEIGRRLFLSRHTVQTHVSHALGKLGLRSRVELAAESVRNRIG